MSLLARPRAARFAIPILLAALWAVAPGSGESGREWTTSSFLDFVDGALTDGGANTYVGADGTVRLINLWDLNNDGQLDLLFPSSHDHNEKGGSVHLLGTFRIRPRRQDPAAQQRG